MNQFNWDQAFTLDFDLNNGLSKHADTTKRYLSQMKNMYQDQEAVEEILKHEDPLIYELYERLLQSEREKIELLKNANK